MTDTRIATDYLNNLFKRLSAGYISGDQHDPDLDPDCVDWAFAAECWMAVKSGEFKGTTDYWSDRRPPAEHLPSYVKMIELCAAYRKAICDEYKEKERHKRASEQLRAERDELIEMLKEILRVSYISDARRKAAYDLVVRLGGYQGKVNEI